MSQRMKPETPLSHRLLMGNYITDEIFGLTIARPGFITPHYTYGAILVAAPCWAAGTALGVMAGNLLPLPIVSSLSVALYGMFLAVIIPPAHKNKVIAILILICFAFSYALSWFPVISNLSAGTRTIILTVGISAIAGFLFPVKQGKEMGNDS